MWNGTWKSAQPLRRVLFAAAFSTGAYGFTMHRDRFEKFPTTALSPNFIFSALGMTAKESERQTRCESTNTWPDPSPYKLMEVPDRTPEDKHAIFDLLLGNNMIEKYEVYKRPTGSTDDNVVIAHIAFGEHLDGHTGIVHGGILSLMFDDLLGFGFYSLGIPMAFTANLNVDYRSPVPAGTRVRVVAQLESREGRKLFWKAQMTSLDQQVLYAEASSLYIIPRSHAGK
ncbi:unnamed protein product [Cylindrotheca closterium]|uniref:Acyl-coenzyme A thioesterase THEM4 n=1 Tax=Cylindrotheca closterium TaxID=2856 RepID=A0AAD2CH41_9STRA|nr:unnamed protein product [Cylindrotheca closterium]